MNTPHAVQRIVLIDDSENDNFFHEIALRWLPDVTRFAQSLTRDETAAEDLVQETYLRAWRHWDTFKHGSEARAWLFTILYHAFVSRKRRIDAREVQPLEDEEGREIFEPVGEADPEGTFYDSFVDQEIVNAIQSLPDEYRAAVVMSDLHGLRYGEIAQVLGVPEGTIKSRLFRGRRLLQAQATRSDGRYFQPPRQCGAPTLHRCAGRRGVHRGGGAARLRGLDLGSPTP